MPGSREHTAEKFLALANLDVEKAKEENPLQGYRHGRQGIGADGTGSLVYQEPSDESIAHTLAHG